jgi:formate C-acetyltransferase
MAQGLRNLTQRAPEDLFEAIQMLMVFYRFQHTVEATLLRTFGRLDQTLLPFYLKEQDREAARQMLRQLITAFDVFDREAANMPFAIGGLDAQGNSAVNELSYELLAAYQEVPCANVKLHLMCSENTPEDFIKLALDGIRKGKNSVVFLSDETVIKSLTNLGATEEDARNYAVLGCYECAAYGEVACTDAGRVSLPLALEAALFGGKHLQTGITMGLTEEMPMDTFEELFAAFEAQLRYFCRMSMEIIDLHERGAAQMVSTPFYSSTFASVMEKGGDIYHDHTAKYNNSSVLAVGLATCTDSLLAIKKMVYEEKRVTLEQLKEILRNNWEGAEVLRLTAKNRYPKFGQADPEADEMANRLVRLLSDEINNKPNTKGGVYCMGAFSITYRWGMGQATGATADGRRAGETLSLNTGASFGSAKFGATAHLISVAKLDNELMSDGSIVDIDLHASAVAGENGLNAMYAALRTYFQLGGFAVHYNVLDLQTLKEAREDPTKHPDLQVRLCGWNSLFSSLSDKEKDEYIARAQEG